MEGRKRSHRSHQHVVHGSPPLLASFFFKSLRVSRPRCTWLGIQTSFPSRSHRHTDLLGVRSKKLRQSTMAAPDSAVVAETCKVYHRIPRKPGPGGNHTTEAAFQQRRTMYLSPRMQRSGGWLDGRAPLLILHRLTAEAQWRGSQRTHTDQLDKSSGWYSCIPNAVPWKPRFWSFFFVGSREIDRLRSEPCLRKIRSNG